MKLWPLGFLIFALAGRIGVPAADDEVVLILSGDSRGYLSPCGCTKPMSGGIRRKATAIRAMAGDRQIVVLENGGFVERDGRQDELKAETLAEAMAAMRVAAVHLTSTEARLGPGTLLSLMRLSGGKLISGSLAASDTHSVPPHTIRAPFLIGAVSMRPEAIAEGLRESVVRPDDAVARLIEEAEEASLVPILMLEGTESQAAELATRFPKLRLIQYQSTGEPDLQPRQVGNTWLVSPGEKGKSLIRLSFRGGKFSNYSVIKLGPDFEDDPHVARLYSTYQQRVDEEGLLERLPRYRTEAYAGVKTCGSCHSEALATWKDTGHGKALKTLEDDGHARDPDCVGCHVTGLDSAQGFRSRHETPDLADVGCESCHGPGLAHAIDPFKVKMPKVGAQSCVPCHTSETSPGFSFEEYWPRIAHQ